jgi:glucose-6-phosphate 1-dehydrogenase
VAMEPPASLAPEHVRDSKAEVLAAVRPFSADELVRGQYAAGVVEGREVPGYRDEERVAPDSTVETFVAVRAWVDNERWKGVPFLLRTGKRMPRRTTEVAIVLRDSDRGLFDDLGIARLPVHHLALRIQPDEGISLRFATKVPGGSIAVRDVAMDFRYGSAFGSSTPEAYERLMIDAMRGDATLFTRADEVDEQWALVDSIVAAWKRDRPMFPNYPAGTWGPSAADELLRRDGRSWRRH